MYHFSCHTANELSDIPLSAVTVASKRRKQTTISIQLKSVYISTRHSTHKIIYLYFTIGNASARSRHPNLIYRGFSDKCVLHAIDNWIQTVSKSFILIQ